ncbi:ABC transporter ATP-binding protein [uncultured Aureimonas sp.]|uniref:ABC transporter ATP-binding protein n=1 Tax=uncultured Aureimonas sp. TaxID=1604662 RepID=UPI002600BE32|nr:ABC transporter ATP-binding protein [uncultured Aureimonas sp.]
MSAPLLRIRDLTIRPRDPAAAPVVEGVSLTLEEGRVLGLIGESGAGKSTLGLAALGHRREGLRQTGGEVLIRGRDLGALGEAALRAFQGRSVAYVAQSASAAFNPARRLGDQVIEASVFHKVMTRPDAVARAKALFALLALPDPETFGAKYPHQASGGQLQRAMTAMALCGRPDLIVFDEPTTALDVTTQIEVLTAIRHAVRSTGTAALYISHDLAVVAQIADDILVLRNGRMIEAGPARAIIERPAEAYTRALVATRGGADAAPRATTEPVLRMEGLAASYAGQRVLDDVTLDLPRGRTLALVGESGSGKSTLARVLTGLLPPDAGQVLFEGRALPPLLAARPKDTLRRMQMIHQLPDVALNPRQRVGEIVGRPLTFYFGLRGADARRRVERLFEEIELSPSLLDRFPSELSGGQKQRVCIARALAADPDVLVCDEPTSALDPLVADGVLELLARVQAERAVSLLFITHDLAIVERIADTVAVLRQGRIVRQGPKDRVLSPPFDPYTERLVASVPRMEIGWLDRHQGERPAVSPDRE